jgi:hypothetical protein
MPSNPRNKPREREKSQMMMKAFLGNGDGEGVTMLLRNLDYVPIIVDYLSGQ